MHPDEIPAYIPDLLYTYLRERLKLKARLQALQDAEPDVLRDACRQAARFGTLQPMVQWLAAQPALVNWTLLQHVVAGGDGARPHDTPPDPWQAQLRALIAALPASVSQMTVIMALRAAWPPRRRACILCDPAPPPTRLNLARLRSGLATGDLPYARSTLERVLCAACWTAYDVQAKWQASQQRADAAARERAEAKADWRWQRRLRNFERGTGTPAGDFSTMCQLLTAEDIQQHATMPYHEFLDTRYWRTVRRYVVYRADGRCHLCPASTALHVHHRTYAHRGQEYQYLEDLVVLCETCHATHHHILPAPPPRPDAPSAPP